MKQTTKAIMGSILVLIAIFVVLLISLSSQPLSGSVICSSSSHIYSCQDAKLFSNQFSNQNLIITIMINNASGMSPPLTNVSFVFQLYGLITPNISSYGTEYMGYIAPINGTSSVEGSPIFKSIVAGQSLTLSFPLSSGRIKIGTNSTAAGPISIFWNNGRHDTVAFVTIKR